jgi:hypothetical protein
VAVDRAFGLRRRGSPASRATRPHCQSSRSRMKTPGPQNPGVYRTNRNVRRSRYFFLAAFFLAAGFLAAFFFAAMLVYLLQSISDPMNGFGDGSQMHSSTRSAGSSVGRFCDGNHEQHHFQSVVILEQDHFCQWISHDGFTLTIERSSSASHHSETAVGGVQERGRAPHRP